MTEDEIPVRMATCIKDFGDRCAESMTAVLNYESGVAADLCKSPIEQTFYLAWITRIYYLRYLGSDHGGSADFQLMPPNYDGPHVITPWTDERIIQVDFLAAQQRIDRYIADFVLLRALRNHKGGFVFSPKLIVECDGHDFHEKTKEQAAHDKERDRVLQTAGYFVLRFTGSELYRNPAKCALQVEAFLEDHLTRIHLESRKPKPGPVNE